MLNPFNFFGFQSGGYINGDPSKRNDELQKAIQIKIRNIIKDCYHQKVWEAHIRHNTEMFFLSLNLFAEEHRN